MTENQNEKEEPLAQVANSEELENLRKELDETKDKYLRLLAENENMKKRLYKEREELIQYALQNLVVDFLNPIDHLEQALSHTSHMSEETKHWALGFQMILEQFKEILINQGVTSFSSKGAPFDPHLHEAVEVVLTTTTPPGIVLEESMKGYTMKGKTIRPARVTVSRKPDVQTESNEGVKS